MYLMPIAVCITRSSPDPGPDFDGLPRADVRPAGCVNSMMPVIFCGRMDKAVLHLRQMHSFHYLLASPATGSWRMLDEIRTFVVLAETGSLQRAAERLFLTPSAVTRQIQRLEGVLKTPLLDRRVKPGRITREGRAVLDSGRHMLRIMDDLKASGAKDAEPSGIFRIGLSHALAQPSLVASIQRLTSRFP